MTAPRLEVGGTVYLRIWSWPGRYLYTPYRVVDLTPKLVAIAKIDPHGVASGRTRWLNRAELETKGVWPRTGTTSSVSRSPST
jgi:hypothetical protein